ncbi:MAG: hypothetical protein CL666_15840 [Balneola sp.]|nr:hypothetical protein [Balneola sp.]|tara:strand:- start:64561 stop:65004 length:444 start_codon:yes stop_codon:yes gene_type:complete
MRFLYLLLIFLILSISCAPSKKPLPFLPPGVELGATWAESKKHGYDEEVYITPEFIAYPLKGNRSLLLDLRDSYTESVCENGPSQLLLQYVISTEGSVIGVHPKQDINPTCKTHLTQTLKRIEFFSAEHSDKKVNMLMSTMINDRRF